MGLIAHYALATLEARGKAELDPAGLFWIAEKMKPESRSCGAISG